MTGRRVAEWRVALDLGMLGSQRRTAGVKTKTRFFQHPLLLFETASVYGVGEVW